MVKRLSGKEAGGAKKLRISMENLLEQCLENRPLGEFA